MRCAASNMRKCSIQHPTSYLRCESCSQPKLYEALDPRHQAPNICCASYSQLAPAAPSSEHVATALSLASHLLSASRPSASLEPASAAFLSTPSPCLFDFPATRGGRQIFFSVANRLQRVAWLPRISFLRKGLPNNNSSQVDPVSTPC